MSDENKSAHDHVYDNFWKPIVEPGGSPDFEVIKQLLFDYAATMNNLSILYQYITEGEITDGQTDVTEVMEASDRYVSGIVDDAVRDLLEDLLNQPEVSEHQDVYTIINSLYEQGNPTK